MDPRLPADGAADAGGRDRHPHRRCADRGLRVLALVIGLLLAALSQAADVLILAPTSALGPTVSRDRVLEPNWILWPPASDGLTRLLPLTTGVDWNLRGETFAVRESGGGQVLLDSAELSARGFFAARRAVLPGRRLLPLARSPGALALEAIALCADGVEPVREVTVRDLSDPRALIVAIAPTGEAIVRARRAATGRVLLIETPPSGRAWSRFYLYGSGWPAEASPVSRRIPGLISAREVPRLLARPESFAWTARAPLLYREADRWLVPARSGFAGWGLVLLSLGAGGAALFELAADRRRLATTIATWLALAFPAAVLLAPPFAASLGPEFMPLAVFVILAAFGLFAWIVSRRGGERAALALISGIGVLGAGWAGPLHSWSGILRDLPRGLSPEAAGAAVLYAATGIAATRDGEGPLWLWARLANLGGLIGLGLHAPLVAFAVPIGWAAGLGALPATVWPAITMIPAGLARMLSGGFDFRPDDLAREFPVAAVANLWRAAAFWLSLPTLLFGFAVGFATITSAPYAGYRLRRIRRGPGWAALVAAGGYAAACALSPELWPGLLVIVAGGLPLFVADAR